MSNGYLQRLRNPLLLISMTLAFLAAGKSAMLRDPGTFWHVALGQRMIAEGEWIREDCFTFTRSGQPWVAAQWLPEMVMAIGFDFGGWDTLLFGACVLLGLIYSRLSVRLLDSGLHPLAVAMTLVLVLGASSHSFHVRPHLLTIGFTALTMALLVDVEAGRRPVQAMGMLIPISLLWTNSHGGVLAGFATTVLVVSGWVVLWVLRYPQPIGTRHHLLWLALALVGAMLMVLVNPYGTDMPRLWWKTMSMDLPAMIEEHAPLDLQSLETWAALALGGFYVATLLSVQGHIRVTWLMPLIWWALAWTRVRHAPLFAVITSLALSDMLPYSRMAAWLEPGDWFRRRVTLRVAPWTAWGVVLLLLLGCAGLHSARIAAPLVGHGWAQLSPTRWPVELTGQLRKLTAASPSARIINTLGMGGFVELFAPGLATYIDDRCELFGNAMLQEYFEAEQRSPERINVWAAEHDCRFAMVNCGSPFHRFLLGSRAWRVVATSEAAVIFERVEP